MAPAGMPSALCPYCHRPVAIVPVAAVSDARRTWTLALIAAAIVAMLAGAFTRSWLTARDGDEELRVGLLGGEVCDEGECKQLDYDDGRTRDDLMKVLGVVGKVAIAGTLAVIAMLGWCGARVVGRRPAFGPGIAGIILASLASVGAVMWAYQMKTQLGVARLSYGYSFLLYVAGAILGFVGCVMARGPGRGPS
jgi:hypothetical protein